MGELIGLVAVTLIFGMPFFAIWAHHKRKLLQMSESGGSQELTQLRAKLDRMEQRLAVLEKLATDPAARLSEDIERLRERHV